MTLNVAPGSEGSFAFLPPGAGDSLVLQKCSGFWAGAAGCTLARFLQRDTGHRAGGGVRLGPHVEQFPLSVVVTGPSETSWPF